MSDKIRNIIDGGTGVYSISKKEAGEIHKAADAVLILEHALIAEGIK